MSNNIINYIKEKYNKNLEDLKVDYQNLDNIVCLGSNEFCNKFKISKDYANKTDDIGYYLDKQSNFQSIKNEEYENTTFIIYKPLIYKLYYKNDTLPNDRNIIVMRHSDRANVEDTPSDQEIKNDFYIQIDDELEQSLNTNLSLNELKTYKKISESVRKMNEDNLKITTIYSSPFRRCIQTAIILKYLTDIPSDVKIIILPELCEAGSAINRIIKEIEEDALIKEEEYNEYGLNYVYEKKASMIPCLAKLTEEDYYKQFKINGKTEELDITNIKDKDINTYIGGTYVPSRESYTDYMHTNLSNIEERIKNNNKHSIYVTHGDILDNIVNRFNNYTVLDSPTASFIASDKDNEFFLSEHGINKILLLE